MALSGLSYAGAEHSHHGGAPHWGYEGETGPNNWGHLAPEFDACIHGKSQSPIDISAPAKTRSGGIDFKYNHTPLKIINNGHTIQVNYERGSSVTIDGKQYHLLQFHFHTPSENTVDGNPHAMEAHLVHRSDDGQLAVVGVFIKKGKHNPFVQTLWDNLPSSVGEEKSAGVKINAIEFLPADKTYHHFSGSLTTPPCSEGVNWNVMKTPVEVSDEQVAKFSSFFKMNARPVQPLNGRVIELVD